MHVTHELAGLIAQVFPTLIIVLMIEGRFWYFRSARSTPDNGELLFALMMHLLRILRGLAVITSLTATMACLMLVGTPPDDQGPAWLDAFVTVAFVLLFTSVGTAAIIVMARQRHEDNRQARMWTVRIAENYTRAKRFRERAQHAKDTWPDSYDD
jgi:hypothetical protein